MAMSQAETNRRFNERHPEWYRAYRRRADARHRAKVRADPELLAAHRAYQREWMRDYMRRKRATERGGGAG